MRVDRNEPGALDEDNRRHTGQREWNRQLYDSRQYQGDTDGHAYGSGIVRDRHTRAAEQARPGASPRALDRILSGGVS